MRRDSPRFSQRHARSRTGHNQFRHREYRTHCIRAALWRGLGQWDRNSASRRSGRAGDFVQPKIVADRQQELPGTVDVTENRLVTTRCSWDGKNQRDASVTLAKRVEMSPYTAPSVTPSRPDNNSVIA